MNAAWQTLHSVAVEPLGWMVLHSVWQLACLAAVFAVIRRWLTRSAPQFRYGAAGVTLALMVLLPAATFFVLVPPLEPPSPEVAAIVDGSGIVDTSPLSEAALPTEPSENGVDAAKLKPPPLQQAPRDPVRSPAKLASFIRPCLPWIVAAWSVGVVLLSMWNLGGWIAVQRMTHLGVRPAAPSIERAVIQLRQKLNVSRALRVVESLIVQAPSVIGWLRPVILLPAGLVTGLTPSQLEAVLAHELAHVRRLDYLANLLQTVVETLFFYHPAVHYVSKQMRVEREYCADQLAIAVVGDRLAYAKTLSEIGERIEAGPQFVLAATGGNLADRVRRLFGLATSDGGRTGSWLIGAAMSLVVLAGLVAVPTVRAALAQADVPRITMRRIPAPFGRISPDGRYVAYTNWDNGNLGVYDVETSEKRELTTEGSLAPYRAAENSIWSPDSRQLAYVWFQDDAPPEIRVISLEGNPPKIIHTAPKGGWAYTTDWPRDGEHVLAYLRSADGDTTTAQIRIADGAIEPLENVPDERRTLDLSPNGRVAVFAQQGPGRSDRDLFLYNLETQTVHPLVQHPADDYAPQWSPDGHWLTFLSTRSGGVAAWMAPFDANDRTVGEPRQLSPEAPSLQALGITDRGQYAMHGFAYRKEDIYQVAYDPESDTTVGSPQPLVQLFEGQNQFPVWSPDGSRLAFFSRRPTPRGGTAVQIVVRDERTGEEMYPQVSLRTTNHLGTSHLAWHPDGRRLFIYGVMPDEQGQRVRRILAYDVDSHEATPVLTKEYAKPTSILHVFAVSADGEAILYGNRADGSFQLIRRRIRDGREETLVRQLPPAESMAVSPDGKLLALSGQRTIHLLDLNSREHRLLYRVAAADRWINRGIAWTAAGDYLLFTIRNEGTPRQTELLRIAPSGGEPRPVGVTMSQMMYPTVHPTGRQLAFSGGPPTPGGVWLIEHSLLMEEE